MATLHPKRKPPPLPYDFTGERERIATHEARFENAKDNNGRQPTCPYCYATACIVYQDGRKYLACKCKS